MKICNFFKVSLNQAQVSCETTAKPFDQRKYFQTNICCRPTIELNKNICKNRCGDKFVESDVLGLKMVMDERGSVY